MARHRGRAGAALRSTGRNDEYYTPPWLFAELALTFDLDVAAIGRTGPVR